MYSCQYNFENVCFYRKENASIIYDSAFLAPKAPKRGKKMQRLSPLVVGQMMLQEVKVSV